MFADPYRPMNSIMGTPITISAEAYETRQIFPDKPRTKRRLRRTKAKFGRTQYNHPMAYRMGNSIVMHPTIYAALETTNQRTAGQ